MITAYSPAMNTHRTNYNNKNIKFGDKLSQEEIKIIKEGTKAGKLNTILGHIGAGKYTKEENEGIMRQITKECGGSPVVHAINKAFGFKFPK